MAHTGSESFAPQAPRQGYRAPFADGGAGGYQGPLDGPSAPLPAGKRPLPCPAELAHLYEGESNPLYLWPNPPRGELPW